jgi:ABC-type transport system involved in multi-copper enzyme maturation permease subunit
LGQLFAIIRNTVLETIRQPVYALVTVLTCGVIALSPAFAAHIYTFGAGSGMEHSAERMVADLGLSTVLMAGLLLAVFSTASVISQEIENKTALTVLSKSIHRSTFIFGKYLGVSVAIGLSALTATMTLLLTIRMGVAVAVSDPIDMWVLAGMLLVFILAGIVATFRNYFKGKPWIGSFIVFYIIFMFVLFAGFSLIDKEHNLLFLATTDGENIMSPSRIVSYDWEVARAALLTLEAVFIMAGVAVAASTRFSTGGNFSVCIIAFLGGLTSEFVRAKVATLVAQEKLWSSALPLAKTWQALVPDLQTFWMSDALTREMPIPFDYMLQATAYAGCYILAMLFVAAFMFEKREVA